MDEDQGLSKEGNSPSRTSTNGTYSFGPLIAAAKYLTDDDEDANYEDRNSSDEESPRRWNQPKPKKEMAEDSENAIEPLPEVLRGKRAIDSNNGVYTFFSDDPEIDKIVVPNVARTYDGVYLKREKIYICLRDLVTFKGDKSGIQWEVAILSVLANHQPYMYLFSPKRQGLVGKRLNLFDRIVGRATDEVHVEMIMKLVTQWKLEQGSNKEEDGWKKSKLEGDSKYSLRQIDEEPPRKKNKKRKS